MWVTYDNLWLFYVGSAGLILALYAVKAAVLRYIHSPREAAALFAIAVAACVPVTLSLSPDWNNDHVFRVGIFVGSPVVTLAVPFVSFHFDLMRRSAGRLGKWWWRMPLELLIGVPLWLYFWVFFELMVLGWVWI